MKKFLSEILIGIMSIVPLSVSAMTTKDFDSGMAKGINYFNRGLYYEARDEFQWFCDANWGSMNSGQQNYALGYLDSSKQRIQKWEQSQNSSIDYSKYLGIWECYNPSYKNGLSTGYMEIKRIDGKNLSLSLDVRAGWRRVICYFDSLYFTDSSTAVGKGYQNIVVYDRYDPADYTLKFKDDMIVVDIVNHYASGMSQTYYFTKQ